MLEGKESPSQPLLGSSEQPSVGEERYVTTLILVCRAVVEICIVNVRLHIFNNRPSATKNVFAGKRYFSLNKAKEEKNLFCGKFGSMPTFRSTRKGKKCFL